MTGLVGRFRGLLIGCIALIQRGFWVLMAGLLDRGGRLRDCVQHNGIVVFVGPNGSGKSLAAVDSLLGTLDGTEWECVNLDHGHNRPVKAHVADCDECRWVVESARVTRWLRRRIAPRSYWVFCEDGRELADAHSHGVRLAYSTLPLIDEQTGEDHALYRPLVDYRQLVEIEHADVLFDEVAGVSDASDSASTPAALTRWLQQLRKRDVRLRVTTPAYKRCSLPIRQVATLVVDCRSFFAADADGGRLWRPRRAMVWEAYDGFSFADFDKTTGERLKREAVRHYWRPAGRAQHCYSTLAQVHALAEVTEAGMCMACGGSRSRPKCACTDDLDLIPYGELQVVERVTAGGGRTRKAERIAG